MHQQTITSERQILIKEYIEAGKTFPTTKTIHKPIFENPVSSEELGEYREIGKEKLVNADCELIKHLIEKNIKIPSFLEAGPREKIAFDSREKRGIKAAVVATGGLAPGLNSVIHAVVARHIKTYSKLVGENGGVWGVIDSFGGLLEDIKNWVKLRPEDTENWLEHGGCELGIKRYWKIKDIKELATQIAANLENLGINILYVIGGDGSLTTAHEIAQITKKTIVVGIPKTMDNDILWVWQSFGYNTSVESATAFINTMHAEAESTRRVCIVELFGARAGFVAANATLASRHVDLVLIPELFKEIEKNDAEEAIRKYSEYLKDCIQDRPQNPFAIIILAEGVGKQLAECNAIIGTEKVKEKEFPEQFSRYLDGKLFNTKGEKMDTFVMKPRYAIRAIPANSYDQIYCKRLGALAVDNALAGFTDVMISQWLTEYVLVPLELVAGRQKHIPPGGIFWKQVVASTGQPMILPKKFNQNTIDKQKEK